MRFRIFETQSIVPYRYQFQKWCSNEFSMKWSLEYKMQTEDWWEFFRFGFFWNESSWLGWQKEYSIWEQRWEASVFIFSRTLFFSGLSKIFDKSGYGWANFVALQSGSKSADSAEKWQSWENIRVLWGTFRRKNCFVSKDHNFAASQ